MAELAIGGVFPPRHRGMVCDSVDRVVLERDRIAKQLDVKERTKSSTCGGSASRQGRAWSADEGRRSGYIRRAARTPRRRAVAAGTSVDAVIQATDATAALFTRLAVHGDLAYTVDGELVLWGASRM